MSMNDTAYLQRDWRGGADFQHDELQEILAQFESSAYLRDLNLFGGLKGTDTEVLRDKHTSSSSGSNSNTSNCANNANNNNNNNNSNNPLTLPEEFPRNENNAPQSTISSNNTGKRKAKDLAQPPAKKTSSSKKASKKASEDGPSSDDEEALKKRESHNATERRRREKINEKIDELRKLLPGGGKGVNKAAVLHQTAERTNCMQMLLTKVLNEKRRLEASRNELIEEVYRLRTALTHYQHLSLASHPPQHPHHHLSSQSPPQHQQQQQQQPLPPHQRVPLQRMPPNMPPPHMQGYLPEGETCNM